MIKAHKNIAESENLDMRSYCLLSKTLLKMIEKIYKNSGYFVSENNSRWTDNPPE